MNYLCVVEISCWSERTLEEDLFEMRVHNQVLLGETAFWDLGLFWIPHLTYCPLNKQEKIGCQSFSLGFSFRLVYHGFFPYDSFFMLLICWDQEWRSISRFPSERSTESCYVVQNNCWKFHSVKAVSNSVFRLLNGQTCLPQVFLANFLHRCLQAWESWIYLESHLWEKHQTSAS